MRNRLSTLIAILVLLVSSLGVLLMRTAHAQCGCSCSSDCQRNCTFSCEGCGLTEWVSVAAKCCDDNYNAIKGSCTLEE